MTPKPSPAKLQKQVETFNAEHPIGTPVFYWTGLREGPGKAGKTRSKAKLLGGEAVVWIEGYPACVALSHVKVVDTRSGQ